MQKLSPKEETVTFSISMAKGDHEFIIKECEGGKRDRCNYIRQLITNQRNEKNMSFKDQLALLEIEVGNLPYDLQCVLLNNLQESLKKKESG